MVELLNRNELVELTTEIVTSYLSYHKVGPAEIGVIIGLCGRWFVQAWEHTGTRACSGAACGALCGGRSAEIISSACYVARSRSF
jgi:hypothetical protein